MMEHAIQKADVLIEAMRWIREHRGKITVIKMGGSVMEDKEAMTHLLLDIVFMETVDMQPVIVHGGGAAISDEMKRQGLEPRFVQGRRYTDEASLAIVREVLGRQINESIVDQIEMLGGIGHSLTPCYDNGVLFGERIMLNDEHNTPVDMGLVGQVTRVDTRPILRCCHRGVIPVIPSVALFDDGSKNCLNVNADTAATAVARALQAEKLIFVSEVNGVRTNPDDPKSMVESITSQRAREMLSSGAIVGGMIPKIQACLETLERGVKKIHIINGRLRHSLLLEIFTSSGVGTEISAGS